MIFWTIIVFLLGLFGLLHEIWLVEYGVPMFNTPISVAIMLIALGMFYSQIKHKKDSEK